MWCKSDISKAWNTFYVVDEKASKAHVLAFSWDCAGDEKTANGRSKEILRRRRIRVTLVKGVRTHEQ